MNQVTIKQVDAARRYGVSDRTLRRWEKKGLLTGTRVQGTRFYQVAQIERLVGAK